MLESVKISRRQSEIRQSLASLVGKSDLSEDETRSIETLDAEYRSNETKYRGALIVLARHAGRRPALMFEFLRKLLVGGYFVLRRKLSPRLLLGAFSAAGRNFLSDASQPLHLGSKAFR